MAFALSVPGPPLRDDHRGGGRFAPAGFFGQIVRTRMLGKR
jgi:hypothetical protein